MKKTKSPFNELVRVMALLRSPQGCPWDKHQTHQTLRKYLREETREVLEAIDERDPEHLQEELGDVLLQVIFHAQIARENKEFDINDVIRGLTRKLKRRHPHVFGKVRVKNAAEVVRNWHAIKKKEKTDKKR
ncbi:MAG: MazG family protein [bacterium]|nr:MazG family protein [bacterium]MDD5354770.1 MazG family protein [bacterium]MDD5755817.1 MazG family protein [bacterium]